MKVSTDLFEAMDLIACGAPVFYSHLTGPLFGRSETERQTTYVVGRRYRGQFNNCDGSYVVITINETGEVMIDRDPFGSVPVYYSTTDPFASTDIRLLLSTGLPDFDVGALAEYLSSAFLTGGKTIYQGVRCLMPNESLKLTAGQFRPTPKQIFPDPTEVSARDVERLLESAIDNSIADMMGRFPGTMLLNLSGGADSTLLLAKMKERDPARKIITTTFFHEDWRDDLNDWEFAAEAASAFRSDHKLCKINNESFSQAHRDLMHSAKTVFHTYAAAFYLQNKPIMLLEPGVPIVNGSGPDESMIGTEKISIGALSALAAMRRDEWLSYLIENVDYLKLSESAVAEFLPAFTGGFVADRKSVASALLDASNFVEFQRRYHAVTVLTDHIQELSSVALSLGRPILFPYLTHDIFKIVFSARFEVLNENAVYKSAIKAILEKYMPPRFVHRDKVGFQSPSRPYFKSNMGLGRELPRLLAKSSAVLDIKKIRSAIEKRLAGEIDLRARYDFLEWTAYNVLLLEQMRRTNG